MGRRSQEKKPRTIEDINADIAIAQEKLARAKNDEAIKLISKVILQLKGELKNISQ